MSFPDIIPFPSIIHISNRVSRPPPPHHRAPQWLTLTDLISFRSEKSPPRQILARMYSYIPYQVQKDEKWKFHIPTPPVVIILKATLR